MVRAGAGVSWWMGVCAPVRATPVPPRRAATISAAMDRAVSSGVRAPRSRPMGDLRRASSSSVTPPGGASCGPGGCGGAHRADVGDRQTERQLQQRYVELGVVGEDAQHRAGVHLRAGQVLVRPLHDDLVRLREARPGREHRPRVAHGDVVAEELADPYQRRREVDRAEHDHPGRRHRRLDQHGDGLPAARALLPYLHGAGTARVQEGARLGDDRAVQLRVRAEAALVRTVGEDGERAAAQMLRALDDAGERRRPPARHRGERGGQHGAGGVGRPYGVTITSMIPPQVRPTAKASSSL